MQMRLYISENSAPVRSLPISLSLLYTMTMRAPSSPSLGRLLAVCLGFMLGSLTASAEWDLADFEALGGPNPQDNLPGGIRSPLTKPTMPAPLDRFIQPWEPHRALVVALTPSFLTNQPESLQTYLNLFRIAARYMDILVVVPFDRPEVQVQVVQLLAGDEEATAVE